LPDATLTSLLLPLLLLLALAHLLGHLFVRLRQPRVCGEILAGIVLGPALLGRLPSVAHAMAPAHQPSGVFGFIYALGLLLLMFLSGAEMRQLFTRDERREAGVLAAVGTGLPFVLAIGFSGWLIRPSLLGPDGNRPALMLVLGIAVAVTSVPVLAKIFADLKILHTRFARLVLGVAVLEDIGLWLALALATALAGRGKLVPRQLAFHLAATVAFFGLGLTLLPRLVKRINKARLNFFARQSPIAYSLAVLFAYCALAGALGVSLVFAAFLAGLAVVHKKRRLFAESLDALGKISFAFFIPLYFAIVGLKLDLVRGFALYMFVAFLLGSCAVKVLAVALAGRCAGFRGLDLLNLAITTNARGGPGIVLASVAFDAGIISASFYTTLVLAAVLTSQIAGAWLDLVLRRGWPLLQPVAGVDAAEVQTQEQEPAAA
jgi:Kef-type K+ transport system membrane component KefB